MTISSVFEAGRSYIGVYFLEIDAAGHSSIVTSNTNDVVDKVFDTLERIIFSTVEGKRQTHNCGYAEFWGWQGDGGLCVVYDENESLALKTVIASALDILDFKLTEHQSTLKELEVKGDLHLRLAIHRGSFTYKGYDRHGSIHSSDLNFVAHLESATPKNCLTITEDVYQRCPSSISEQFKPLDFPFEGSNIYLYTKESNIRVMYDWIVNTQISESESVNMLPRRYSEEDKAHIIRHATTEVVDLGTALRTCSYYLGSGHRPAFYHPTVIDLLEQGVNYICFALNPDSEPAKYYASVRREDLKKDVQTSIEKMARFSEEVKGKSGRFALYLYSTLPYFAAITIDRKKDGLLIYAPYMPSLKDLTVERADSPHLVITKTTYPILFHQVDSFIDVLMRDPDTIRVL